MNAIILQNANGDHLGFDLCAIPEGKHEGDCVFSIVPKDAPLIEHPDVQELLRRKDQRESRILVTVNSQSITIQTPDMDDMIVTLNESGVGHWGYARKDGYLQVGRALIPRK